MMLERYGISVGSHINIKRSDGRVHPAVISGNNEATHSVTVEWFENDETKGKEIDIRHVVSINNLKEKKKVEKKKQPAAAAVAPSSQRQAPRSNNRAGPKEPKEEAAVAAAASRNKSAAPAASASPPSSSSSSGGGGNHNNNANPNAAMHAPRERGNGKGDNKQFSVMIDKYRQGIAINPFDREREQQHQKISVCVRKRPMNKKEKRMGDIDVITTPDNATLLLHEAKVKVDLTKYLDNHRFQFDTCFDASCDNRLVYKYTAQPLVRSIFDRGMATCFAYGQTGSGKTYTMGGEWRGGVTDESGGVYAFAAADVFALNSSEYASQNLSVSVSYFEIYGGKVFDLLNKQKRLRVLEDGNHNVQIVGLSEKVVGNVKDVQRLLHTGNSSRATGTTSANANSSRSHAVFQIILRPTRNAKKVHGKFSLIDLAGNERGADTANCGRQRRIEGAEINKSLLALKECIRALGRKGSHTPFRASKLTQVLRDSFISPRASTCMIAMVAPGKHSCEHTLNTLRYANRVKELAPKGKLAAAVAAIPDASAAAANEEMQKKAGGGDGGADEGAASTDAAADNYPQSPLNKSLARQDLAKLHQSMRAGGDFGGAAAEGMFDYHNQVAQIMEMEERVVEEHRSLVQFSREMMHEEESLLEEVDKVDNDLESYAQRLEEIISVKMGKLQHLRHNLSTFRRQLKYEEDASKNVTGMRFA